MEDNFWASQVAQPEDETELPVIEEQPHYISPELVGLLRIGKLTEEIEIWGNRIVLRTLTVGEELEASLLASKFSQTMDSDRAYITALVAAAVQYENGMPLIRALGPHDEENTIERRFRYILQNWYWPVVQAIYTHYAQLVGRADQALGEFEKK